MIEGIRWIREPESKHKLVLYVKQDGIFVRYNKSVIAQIDHPVTEGSLGYATAQYALKQGYKYV